MKQILINAIYAFGRYLFRIGDATSQWVNVAFLLSKNPNESISGRSWRMRRYYFWGKMRILIDWLASPFEEDHCQRSHEADVARAAQLLREQGM
jgi:hypothetical protein